MLESVVDMVFVFYAIVIGRVLGVAIGTWAVNRYGKEVKRGKR